MRILAVCGSLNRQSSNLELLQTAKRVAPPHIEIVVFDGLGQLPLFNSDLEEAPTSVVVWRRAQDDSQAVLIASPEYIVKGPHFDSAVRALVLEVIQSVETKS
jgi:chromate reductase, NAD(P)H dehydrogenase (quinone)